MLQGGRAQRGEQAGPLVQQIRAIGILPEEPGQAALGTGQAEQRGKALLVGVPDYRRRRSLDGTLLVDFAVDLVKGMPIEMDMVFPAKEPGGQPTIVRYQQTSPPRLRLEAAMWLADRGWGKPIQEVAVQPGKPLTIMHRLLKPGQDPLVQPDEGEVALPLS